MKVSKLWLKELVNLNTSIDELERLIPMRLIGLKEVTTDYIELDMKGYNRADLLSMRGVAREVAAITDSKIKFSDIPKPDTNLPKTNIKVVDEKLCPVYCIAKIEGLKVEPSPKEWVKKLTDSGMRSVNNVADITNLMMLEFGQPMHSFDADTVKDETLIVRTAKQGEKLVTLDNKSRDLEVTDLLIADPEKPLGLAGVMGGKNSEVTNSTKNILLEAAIFDPISIRKSVQKHQLYSEASKRFQHGLTKTNLLQALARAIQMYEELGGKVTAISLTGDLEDKKKMVHLRQQKINSLMGIGISPKDVESYLVKLGFSLSQTEDGWDVTVPYYRLDISIEEDLIEDIARIFGYENIPANELKGALPEKIDQSLFELIYKIKKSLADIGLTEVQTYSFFSTQTLISLGWMQGDNKKYLVKVANPISAETEYLRQNIWPNLVETVDKNLRQGFGDIAIFELGKAYFMQGNENKEQYRLAIALMNGTNNPISELYQIVKKGLSDVGLEVIFKEGKQDGPLPPLFHPTRFMEVNYKDKPIGGLSEVHPRILDSYGISKRVAVLEINLIDFV